MFTVAKNSNPGLVRLGLLWIVSKELYNGQRRTVGHFTSAQKANEVARAMNSVSRVKLAETDAAIKAA